ncbi:MAG: Crp/Fnr family transcriptional regulator [Acidobacteria bacterium]|nr:Crp/Fnr family transcriptional regulator [Acidobacteriota bacterium]
MSVLEKHGWWQRILAGRVRCRRSGDPSGVALLQPGVPNDDNRTGDWSVDIVESCAVCLAHECIFRHLGAGDLAVLSALQQRRVVMAGAALFTDGHSPQGLFILCSGRVKVTASSVGGRSLILRIAGPGDVLGLSALISNTTYAVSARALELTQFNFIARDAFLRFLEDRSDLWSRVAAHLAAEVHRSQRQVSRIALAPTARAKLAGLLLDWIDGEAGKPGAAIRFSLPLTHEEVGELIGSSRETVARLFAQFRRQNLIQVRGRFVTVPDRRRLEAMTDTIAGPARRPTRFLTLAAR